MFCSFSVGSIIFPLIITKSHKNKYFKQENNRSMHQGFVSTLGGIGIFSGIFITSSFVSGLLVNYGFYIVSRVYFALFPLIIVFFLGVWDDLEDLKPSQKILLQILSGVCLLTLNPNLVILDLSTLFPLPHIPYLIGFALTLLLIFFIINAVNLLDGIDGLVGGHLLLSSVFILSVALINSNTELVVLTASCAGVLLIYLKYNVFNKRKLFMGDSGSLVLGLFLIFLGLSLREIIQENDMELKYQFSWLFVLLALPIVDTLRVIYIRLKNKKSIIRPDKNHLHHRYVALGLTHFQTSFILNVLTLVFWILCFYLEFLPELIHFLLMLLMAPFLYLLPLFVFKKDMET